MEEGRLNWGREEGRNGGPNAPKISPHIYQTSQLAVPVCVAYLKVEVPVCARAFPLRILVYKA